MKRRFVTSLLTLALVIASVLHGGMVVSADDNAVAVLKELEPDSVVVSIDDNMTAYFNKTGGYVFIAEFEDYFLIPFVRGNCWYADLDMNGDAKEVDVENGLYVLARKLTAKSLDELKVEMQKPEVLELFKQEGVQNEDCKALYSTAEGKNKFVGWHCFKFSDGSYGCKVSADDIEKCSPPDEGDKGIVNVEIKPNGTSSADIVISWDFSQYNYWGYRESPNYISVFDSKGDLLTGEYMSPKTVEDETGDLNYSDWGETGTAEKLTITKNDDYTLKLGSKGLSTSHVYIRNFTVDNIGGEEPTGNEIKITSTKSKKSSKPKVSFSKQIKKKPGEILTLHMYTNKKCKMMFANESTGKKYKKDAVFEVTNNGEYTYVATDKDGNRTVGTLRVTCFEAYKPEKLKVPLYKAPRLNGNNTLAQSGDTSNSGLTFGLAIGVLILSLGLMVYANKNKIVGLVRRLRK